jgi:hypothetical protein
MPGGTRERPSAEFGPTQHGGVRPGTDPGRRGGVCTMRMRAILVDDHRRPNGNPTPVRPGENLPRLSAYKLLHM